MNISNVKYTKNKDIIIVSFPYNGDYDWQEIEEILQNIKKVFPKNVILCIPDNIKLTFLGEENPFL